ncbi:MAG: hypothetical protein IPP66_02495 [Anaerolineales bacterium]|nr:hypothetical protein [Anaerolineales bacterium]
MPDERLERAVKLVKSGKVDEARTLLELIIKDDRTLIPAWRWYAETMQKKSDKVRVWEYCLRYNPSSQEAQQALASLNPNPPTKILEDKKIPSSVRHTPVRSRSSQWLVWGGLVLFIAFAVFVAVSIKNFTPKDPANYKHTQPVEYYLYVPENYSADKEWPLFVGVHGAGGSGLECWNLWQSSADKEGYILLCPTIPGDSSGYYQDVGENTVWNAINAVKREYRVKPRMFLSGFSAGAFFIQGFALHYPEYVNSLSILSAGVYLNPREFPLLIPMLVVIGDQDDGIAVQTSKLFVNDLQAIGFDIHYEVLPNVGHTVTQKGVDLTIDLFRKTSR